MSDQTTLPLVLSAEDMKALAVALGPVFRAAGLAVVPRVPTDAMLAAVDCGGAKADWPSGRAWRAGWAAMVEAANG